MSHVSGGDRFAKALDALAESLSTARSVRVGFLRGSTCGRHNDQPSPQVAFIHEFGAPNAGIPARPFFRLMITKNSPRWGKLVDAALKLTKYDSAKALEVVGLKMVEQLQTSIEEFTTPPLKQETIDRKGFATPLQDSKNMKRSVWYEVSGDEQ